MRKHKTAIILFILLTLTVTFPLCLKLNSCIPGFHSTDEPYGALWDFWRMKYSVAHKISLSNTPLIGYPFGIVLYPSGMLSSVWIGINFLLSLLTTGAFTWNIQVLLNFFLSCMACYFLVLYLTGNSYSAFFSAIAFSFCPYAFARAWQHLGLTYNELIPLSIMTAIILRDKPSKKAFTYLLISMVLLLSFDYSIAYFTAVALAAFIIYTLFAGRDLKFIGNFTFASILAGLYASPQLFTILKNRLTISPTTPAFAFNPYHRPFEDLFSQSAKPLSYLLPASTHPLFGNFTTQFIGSSLYGQSFTEHTLYLGWVPLILAFIAFKEWKKEKKDFYIGFFIFLAIVAWFFSQPPWWKIGPLKIYLPSFFMYKLLPMYRAYCRFGIVVMLAVAVLAGYGLKLILEKFKGRKTKIFLTCLFCSLVLFEFWNWPPYKVIDVSGVPAVYYWLKDQPQDTVIAEYPLDAGSPNEMYKFYQTVHEKKMINGTIPGTPAHNFAQAITRLSAPGTAAELMKTGVKYVLVHRDGYLQTDLVEDTEELKMIPQNKNLRHIKSFSAQDCPDEIMCAQKTGPIDVYEVIAPEGGKTK